MFLKVIRWEIVIILQSCPLEGLEHLGGTFDILFRMDIKKFMRINWDGEGRCDSMQLSSSSCHFKSQSILVSH